MLRACCLLDCLIQRSARNASSFAAKREQLFRRSIMYLALAIRTAMTGGAGSFNALPVAFAVAMAWFRGIGVPPARTHALAFSRLPCTLVDRLSTVPFSCWIACSGVHITGMLSMQLLLLRFRQYRPCRRGLLDAA